ncbi:MAG: tRNA A-37 threonylcarbamoyl transferase component Bud32 [Planctomycetota bacterium]|jgi:tRNA A-37 threonylcarbamoyl transferase component Bud32
MSSTFTSKPLNFGYTKPLVDKLEMDLTATEAKEWIAALDSRNATRHMRSIPGRETYLVEHNGRAVVVKATLDDLPRERWYDNFHGSFGRLPGQREYDNLDGLRRAGFRVPEPIGWARDAEGRSLVAMEYVAHREDLFQRLGRADFSERVRWGERLVDWVARLHTAGFYHRDLYFVHFILAEDSDELVLLDAGRTRCEPAPRKRWFIKDLAALYHSRPATVSPKDALRLLSAYLLRTHFSNSTSVRLRRRSELNRWARRVDRKAQRLAAHRPKYVDSSGIQSFSGEGEIQL